MKTESVTAPNIVGCQSRTNGTDIVQKQNAVTSSSIGHFFRTNLIIYGIALKIQYQIYLKSFLNYGETTYIRNQKDR